MSERDQHIDRLIARYIAGECSEAEQQELTTWIEQNETNRKYFEGIRFVDHQVAGSHPIISVDVDRAWNNLHHRMNSSLNPVVVQPSGRKLILPVWVRIAAMLVLISGLALLVYRQTNRPAEIQMVAEAPAGQILQHIMPDSSVITLNHNSRLACASDYGKTERRVILQGEAFFSVKHDTGKPFVVESGETFIRVTGTSFNIRGEESDSLIEVIVKTGSVVFFTSANEGVTLIAGETGVYNKHSKKFSKLATGDQNHDAYATRMFVFYNTTLTEVIRQLCRVYDVNIVLANPEIGSCLITVSFEDEPIETVLSIITETLNLKFALVDQNYTIDGEGCVSRSKQL